MNKQFRNDISCIVFCKLWSGFVHLLPAHYLLNGMMAYSMCHNRQETSNSNRGIKSIENKEDYPEHFLQKSQHCESNVCANCLSVLPF